ncbi:MFS transporter [Micromonospora chokoriensis]|uniref:MFS transporter n=1 Tax=Micromonospora chokoriensis TaxID=356851 RepID=UPI0022B44CAF|nr:MFS transporter [Micromonospora chokoriensis]
MPILVGRLITAAGTGVVGPYLVIYLRDVQGFAMVTATAAASITSVAAVIGGMLGGWLLDKFSWRLVTVAVFLLAALGSGSYAFADKFSIVFLASVLFGLGVGAGGGLWPTLIARTVSGTLRSKAFGWDYIVFNAGLGCGGLIGGAIVAQGGHGHFSALFIIDAASFLVCGTILLLFLAPTLNQDTVALGSESGAPKAASVFTDKRLLVVLVLVSALGMVGYGQFESVMPPFITGYSVVPTAGVSLIYAANTIAVVACGALLAKMFGKPGYRLGFVFTAFCWCLSWLLIGVLPMLTQVSVGLVLAVLAGLGFAAGELFLARAMPGAVNSLATPANRGRYNGAASVALNIGRIVGPISAGSVVTAGGALGLFPGLAAAAMLIALASSRFFPRL